MSEPLETIRNLIDECSDEQRRALKLYLRKIAPHPLEREWGIDADTILSAISRSSDLTKRGVRGIIAEAIFVSEVIPTVERSGWFPVDLVGDCPYDAMLKKDAHLLLAVQVKLQRLRGGCAEALLPKALPGGNPLCSRGAEDKNREKRPAKKDATGHTGTDDNMVTESATESTRPYSFGDFDILAVNMHPSSGSWRELSIHSGFVVASAACRHGPDRDISTCCHNPE
jgi:hypothetical protein